jgi:hypothetical protein
MDHRRKSISPAALYARLGSKAEPITVDARRAADFAGAGALSKPGRIALWTKGDSVTRFDSIAISALSTSEERY